MNVDDRFAHCLALGCSFVFIEREVTDVRELNSLTLNSNHLTSATKASDIISISQICLSECLIKYLFEKSMRRKFIISILHFIVFSALISESSAKIFDFNSALYIFCESKFSNRLISIMSIRMSHRLMLSLTVYSWSNACCRHFTLSSENSSRSRTSEMIWSFERSNVLIDISISNAVFNKSVWLCWKNWSKSSWSFARRSRTREESQFLNKFKSRNTRHCVRRLRTWLSDFWEC